MTLNEILTWTRQQWLTALGFAVAALATFLAEAQELSPIATAVLMLVSAILAGASDAISKTIALPVWVTLLAVVGAGATAVAAAGSLVGSRWAWIAGLVATAITAIGKSLFGWGGDKGDGGKMSDKWTPNA